VVVPIDSMTLSDEVRQRERARTRRSALRPGASAWSSAWCRKG